MEFRVWVLEIRGSGFMVWSLGFEVQGLGFKSQGWGFRVYKV